MKLNFLDKINMEALKVIGVISQIFDEDSSKQLMYGQIIYLKIGIKLSDIKKFVMQKLINHIYLWNLLI